MLGMKAKSGLLWFLYLIVKIAYKVDSSNVLKLPSKLFNKPDN